MNWELGTAFKETAGGHLYFVVARVDEKRAVVSLATFKSDVRTDDSCIIEVGEHPFIRNRTYVNYKKAEVWTLTRLDALLDSKKIKLCPDPADRKLLLKILRNSIRSQYVEYRICELMQAQLLALGGE